MNALAKILWLVLGVATWYQGEFEGQPLYCGGYYHQDTTPWVAMDPYYYEHGWECGDELVVYIGGHKRRFTLLDAGPLSRYYIEDFGPDVPIIVDVPGLYWPLDEARSARALVINTSLAKRLLEKEVEHGVQVCGGGRGVTCLTR